MLIICEQSVNKNFFTKDFVFKIKYSFMAIVYKPKNRKHARAHGFLSRTKTKGGRKTIKRRMHKGRKKLGV